MPGVESRIKMRHPVRTMLMAVLCLNPLSKSFAKNALGEVFNNKPQSIYGDEAVYAVLRGEKKIGRHTLKFSQSGEDLTVNVESRLAVKYLGVTVYRYSYEAQEIWLDGQFSSVESVIRDNRKAAQKISAVVESRLLRINKDGKSRSAPLVQFPSNHWHPGVLLAPRLFHTLHARVYKAEPEDLGWEKTSLATGQVVSARRYRYSNGFGADVWYDKDQRWVKLQFNADDGSTITYSCQNCSP